MWMVFYFFPRYLRFSPNLLGEVGGSPDNPPECLPLALIACPFTNMKQLLPRHPGIQIPDHHIQNAITSVAMDIQTILCFYKHLTNTNIYRKKSHSAYPQVSSTIFCQSTQNRRPGSPWRKTTCPRPSDDMKTAQQKV